ncbi:putative hydrolase [Mycobacteroides abscessus subsp. massiliense]|nr:Uncharacterised protein [Mycobacteroides abscessus subsp. abscessus]SLB03545.1 putative hydrolase [Mycobacteroides abscessus subsp. massiliense]
MADLDPASHQHSVDKIFPRLGQTTTTAEVLTLLAAQETNGTFSSSTVIGSVATS